MNNNKCISAKMWGHWSTAWQNGSDQGSNFDVLQFKAITTALTRAQSLCGRVCAIGLWWEQLVPRKYCISLNPIMVGNFKPIQPRQSQKNTWISLKTTQGHEAHYFISNTLRETCHQMPRCGTRKLTGAFQMSEIAEEAKLGRLRQNHFLEKNSNIWKYFIFVSISKPNPSDKTISSFINLWVDPPQTPEGTNNTSIYILKAINPDGPTWFQSQNQT